MLLRYHVFYTNPDWKPDNNEPANLDEMGIISCKSYNHAVDELNNYYSKDSIYEFRFMPLEDILTKDEISEDGTFGNFWG